MLTTATIDGVKVSIHDYRKEDYPGKVPLCPLAHKLIAKKGKKVVHHFAHYDTTECSDSFRREMTHWHAQWQKIVLDKANVEICLDPEGNIVGNSSFHGGTHTNHTINNNTNNSNNSNNNNNNNNSNNANTNIVMNSSVVIPSILKTNPLSMGSIMAGVTPAIFNIDNNINNTTDNKSKAKSGQGAQYGTESHIADLIKPMTKINVITGIAEKTRPCVIEIQNSPIDKDTIEAREAYYKSMIWLFNLCPRVVAGPNSDPHKSKPIKNKNGETDNKGKSKGEIAAELRSDILKKDTSEKHNKIVFVDGKISYLKEKVSYVALITSSCRTLIPTEKPLYVGDECLSETLVPIAGTFVIINTRTKHWYDTTAPTYFDCGFGILRMLRKLDKGFAFTMYLSYEEFMTQRMPEIDIPLMRSCDWFHSLGPMSMIRLNVMPKAVDVPSIMICNNRVIINHEPGMPNELSGLGMEQGRNEWHGGEFYVKVNTKSKSQTTNAKNNNNFNNANNATMMGFMNQAANAVILPTTIRTTRPAMMNEAMIIAKLRRYLCASNSLDIEIVNLRGVETLIVNCIPETYGMKDKFKALGMSYVRKATSKKGGKAKGAKAKTTKTERKGKGKTSTDKPVTIPYMEEDTFDDLKSPDPIDNKTNPYYYVKVDGLDAKLNSLM